MRGEGTPYLTSIYWDLRHGAPATDAEFRTRLAEEVAAVLVPLRPDLEEKPNYAWLSVVLGILDDEGKRLLIVLDGLDRVLAAPGVTRNLWDNLRALAQKRSLRLVTGSRRKLREICAGEDSRTSDFWDIFHDPPLRLGPFDAADWEDVLRPIADRRTIDPSAAKEIANWTGGVPVLTAALALRLLDGKGTLAKAEVDTAAQAVLSDSSLLAELWDDCEEELRGDLVDLARGPLQLAQIPTPRKASLVGRGYAVESGAQLKASCRLMEAYARAAGSGVSDLRRLFAEEAGYLRNVRAMLELRLAQVQGASPESAKRRGEGHPRVSARPGGVVRLVPPYHGAGPQGRVEGGGSLREDALKPGSRRSRARHCRPTGACPGASARSAASSIRSRARPRRGRSHGT